MCALKLMRSGSPLGELAAQQTEGGGIRREYGLSLLVLLIVYLIPLAPLSPLRGALPGESLLINGRGFWYLYVSSVSLICAYILMRSGPPWRSWLRSRLRGGGIRHEYGLSLLVLLIICHIPISPLTASRSSPRGRAS